MKGGMAVRQGFQLIKHGSDIPRHANLIGLGTIGFSPLHSVLAVKGGVRRDGQDVFDRRLTARTALIDRLPRIDAAGPIQADKYRPLQARLAQLQST
jgi:hypothetical protein